jgi:hypothetical protein
MRTASGRVTGHAGTRTAIRVPVVPVYFTPTLRKAVPVPDHRQDPGRGNPFVIVVIFLAVAILIWLGALMFIGAMHESIGPDGAGPTPTVIPGPAVVYPVP